MKPEYGTDFMGFKDIILYSTSYFRAYPSWIVCICENFEGFHVLS
jgi:hypothetical protein